MSNVDRRLLPAEHFDEELLERIFGEPQPETTIDCSAGDAAVVLACIAAVLLQWLL